MSPTSIRLIEPSDGPALAGLRARDRHAYARWLPAQPAEFYTPQGQAAVIESLLASHDQGLAWPGVVVCEGAVIGQVGISSILRGPFQKGFLGYWVSSLHQGRGHTSRAVGLVLRIAEDELKLHRLEAHTQLENLASQAVLRKHGFSPWGIAHDHFYAEGAWRDEVFWERRLTGGPAT
ncbi:GNAT family N-acetyltransferase [Streptomyces fulvorobeus]|uniref:Putative ribosomal-protein-alanine acetyltransferase n=1 Tax=Streptomyces fulvorobeus TaxID=284028 RepID=A0A7J0C0M0_9ACTN|nr:GNAT family protein [Streptomyces fulvorobeus]NYE39359.1 ribosomal-protein-alanine N-acetyltransferase [Streptomyces fulvorobeus]GFM95577.1 putative ribosomal-protein-alanine acetyltransferase [Streptomyces fulvorobeus]